MKPLKRCLFVLIRVQTVPISAVELLFDGKPMMDPMSLKDYGIEAGSTITLEFKRK